MNSYVTPSIVFLVILLFLIGGLGKARAQIAKANVVNVPRMVMAIKIVENWDGHSRGIHGELGAMQWHRDTWMQFSHFPFYFAREQSDHAKKECRATEERWVKWLIHSVNTQGKIESPFTVGLMHRAGYGAMKTNKISADEFDYAERVSNVYADLVK